MRPRRFAGASWPGSLELLVDRVREQGVEEARGAVERDAAAAQTLERRDRRAIREAQPGEVEAQRHAGLERTRAGLLEARQVLLREPALDAQRRGLPTRMTTGDAQHGGQMPLAAFS